MDSGGPLPSSESIRINRVSFSLIHL